MKRFAVLVLLLVAGAGARHAAAQPTSGGPTPGATGVPLDGGASLLLASGLAYALRRLRQRRRAR